MNRIEVTIKGISPLLMNRYPGIYEFDTKVKVKNPNKYEKETMARDKLYLDEKGKLFTPNTHIHGALINAGKKLQIKGQGKATYSKPFGSMVQVEPAFIVHKKQKWDIHSILTRNPNARGARNVTHRPKLDDWELDFTLYADPEIPPEVIKEGLERAGKYVGIGDWRPDTKGIFGKFQVTKFKEK